MSIQIRRGPNTVHPEEASAVGSRNSLNRSGRNEYVEAQSVVDEEVDKVLNHIQSKLPPEVLSKLDVQAGIKTKLHNYYNQNMQNMFNRYMVTVEDELGKKFRDLIDQEEHQHLNQYTPRIISDIIDQIGGADKFNTGEMEKSLVNIYGHLQGSIQRGITDLEQETNSLLRQKTDVGSFVRGENSYSIAKCSFKNNFYKPKTVVDIKLALNVIDSEMISKVYHYQLPVKNLLKDIISSHVHEQIDKEIDSLNQSLIDEGKEELTDGEIIFEKIKAVEHYTDDDIDNEGSKRYGVVAKRFLDSIENIHSEIDPAEFDALKIRENVKRIIDDENIRNRGFNTALNSLTSILDTSKMGYQHVENYKNSRKAVIREYESTEISELPDERFEIQLEYLDQAQIDEMRRAYDVQYEEFVAEIEEANQVVDALYQKYKRSEGIIDFDDVAKEYLPKTESEEGEEQEDKLWNELVFISPEESDVEKQNKTNTYLTMELKRRLVFLKEKIAEIYKNQNPADRLIVDERIHFLEDKFQGYSGLVNPYHIQAGLILEVDITSVKRKKSTMNAMSNVLNEFLYNVSKGFQDKAFAGFSRRRSTVRSDLDEAFGSVIEGLDAAEGTETPSAIASL